MRESISAAQLPLSGGTKKCQKTGFTGQFTFDAPSLHIAIDRIAPQHQVDIARRRAGQLGTDRVFAAKPEWRQRRSQPVNTAAVDTAVVESKMHSVAIKQRD